ncbi:hypothetical protein [Pseudoprimorskyibacter insulae]|uniref:Fructose-bisphosphate aldolase n=1 Tax=Pseudoprimorskyibacter insulae TaxID=1695997 RepID=A0A2R8B0A9_9RHOB|nr:hypothetical protein [Pseudoprimorskyibacter insulae]SPF81716.1 hypothetical protein PRI8871_03541 [Pseudoprimorskyibacter insulae]
MSTRFAQKIARIRAGAYQVGDYMIADAKDTEVTGGVPALGMHRAADGRPLSPRTRPQFIDEVRKIIAQDVVDIMLTAAGTMEVLQDTRAFEGTAIEPAFRGNETTCVWGNIRGAAYNSAPSYPYRGANLFLAPADLCLYSITFVNDIERDLRALEAYAAFRDEARARGIQHFLEVFNPNVPGVVADADLGAFVNDNILRLMASLTQAERPAFLKVAYNGPKAMAELCSHDPSMVVGVLGGAGATHRDTFELIAQSERHGARLALFGRKINQAECQTTLIRWMRRVADLQVTPLEAVRGYHDDLHQAGLTPDRDFTEDSGVTAPVLRFDATDARV